MSSHDPHDCPHAAAVSRRGFLTSVSTGAIGVVSAAHLAATAANEAPPEVTAADGQRAITITVNGEVRRLAVEPRWSLLYVLRERLGLTATKTSCERGECGACTVLIDGETRYACMTLAVEADGHAVTTLEGLMQGEALGPVQQAFAEEDGLQCGFCTPGQIMAVEGLLQKTPTPTIDEVREGVSGNLCRCGTYAHIFKAAQRAATLKGARS
jgi:xanthine dehydrogenase YagT iron-sulfur-binding subunit